jgi:integrase
MASVFRRTYKREVPPAAETVIRQGKPHARWRDAHNRVRVAPLSEDGESIVLTYRAWYVSYHDAVGKRVMVKAFVDKDASEKMAREREKQAALVKSGCVQHDQARARMPIQDAVQAWLDDLNRQGRAPKYVYNSGNQMGRMIDGCGWTTLASIRSDSLSRWLATAPLRKLSGRTKNHFIQIAITFVKWCCNQRPLPWLAGNPLAHVALADQSEKRNARRALTPEELVRLNNVSGKRWIVYLTACLTGLRRAELRSLPWGDVRLDAAQPYVQLRASVTKARRADVIALPAQLVESLRAHGPRDAWDRVFRSIPKYATVRQDFARAAIPWRDEQGRMGGLHALRKTFVTLLVQTDVPIRTAMEMARVTTSRLLHEVYTDSRLLDVSAAAAKLPRLAEGTEPIRIKDKPAR